MPSGPSRRLETFVGYCIPPACREEVLGDLHEKYTGPWQYFALAMCVVPFVILSRIRRTTDLFLLLTEALLIYGSFLAATWYTDKTLLAGQWGLWRLVILTAVNLAVLILEHAWDFQTRWARALITWSRNGNRCAGSAGPVNWPACFWSGQSNSLFAVWANQPHAAAGPDLWLKQRSESSDDSFRAKFALAAAVIITLEAIVQALTGVRPAVVGAVIIIVLAAGLQLSRSRKG